MQTKRGGPASTLLVWASHHMKKIVFQGNGNYIESHLHALVTDEDNILLASMIDNDSSVRGVTANIVEGRGYLTIQDLNKKLSWGDDKDDDTTQRYNALPGGVYNFVTRVVDSPLVHSVVMHKSAVVGNGEPCPIILATDGNLPLAVGDRMAADFAIPRLESWHQPLFDHLLAEGLLEPLNVYVSPMVEMWQDLKAVRASKDLTEDRMMSIVSEGLSKGWLVLPDGDVDAPVFDEQEETLSGYIKQYAPFLVEKVKQHYEPLHDLDQPLAREIATMKRTPFPTQAHVIMALTKGFLQGRKALFAVQDMGTGKTIDSIGVAHVLAETMKKRGQKGFSVLVMAPGLVIPKWIEHELKPTLPWARIRTLENYADVMKYRREKKKDGIEFVLIGRDISKLSTKHRPAMVWKRLKGQKYYAWHCPSCGEPVKVRKEDAMVIAEWSDFALGLPPSEEEMRGPKLADGLPVGFQVRWEPVKRSMKCTATKTRQWVNRLNDMPCGEEIACEEPLTRPALKNRFLFRSLSDPSVTIGTKKTKKRVKQSITITENNQNPRWEPAKLIQKYLKGFFDLGIVDEVHQLKGDSGQGEAFGSIASACKWLLNLTGTLTGGKASDLYRLLFRTGFNRLRDDGFTSRDTVDWVRRYGVLETIVHHDNDEEGVVTRRRKDKKTVKEIPGVAPQLFVKHLMDSCVFLELQDLGLPLVNLEETVKVLDLDEEVKQAYDRYHTDLEQACKAAYSLGIKGAFSKFAPAVINYADQPHLPMAIELGDELVHPNVQMPEDYLTPKERELVADIQEELAQDRGVIVYCSFTDGYAQDIRLKKVLEASGIRADVLKASVSPDDRIAWFEERVKQGIRVVVTNMRLVEVGVDLMDFPSLFYLQGNDQISVVRQSSRRSWRIGQYRNCKVRYYVYNGTYQIKQFQRMMSKRSHALLLEGRLDKSEMAKYMENDKHSSLTRSVTECLVDVDDLSSKWQELAAKDVPEGLDLLTEEEYKAVVDDVKRKLWNQTKELCGVAIDEDVQEVDSDISALSDLFIQKHESELRDSYNGTQTAQFDLFSLFSEESVEQEAEIQVDGFFMEPEPVSAQQTQAYEIVTMNTIVTRITKKRTKKTQTTAPVAQLGWLFEENTI